MPEIFQDTLVVTRPPHFPTMHTRETVMHCAAFGLTPEQCCVVVKCNPDEFRRYYSEDFEHGLTRVNAQVQAAVLHAALHGDSPADRKLWLINKAGWKAGDSKQLGNQLPGEETEMTVVQRRTIIDTILLRATREKRRDEKVVDGRIVAQQQGRSVGAAPHTNQSRPVQPNGAAVARPAGATGSNGATNGHAAGSGSGNGTKHR